MKEENENKIKAYLFMCIGGALTVLGLWFVAHMSEIAANYVVEKAIEKHEKEHHHD